MYEVVFYQDEKGNSELLKYLDIQNYEAIYNKNERTILKQLILYIKVLEQHSIEAEEPFAKRVCNEIWETRLSNNMILLFTIHEKKIILLNYLTKLSNKMLKSEIDDTIKKIENCNNKRVNVDEFAKWSNVVKTITALTNTDKSEVNLMADIITKIIGRQKELGISKREFERMTGIRNNVIYRIENMRMMPQLTTLIKLMEPLGLRLYAGNAEGDI